MVSPQDIACPEAMCSPLTSTYIFLTCILLTAYYLLHTSYLGSYEDPWWGDLCDDYTDNDEEELA